MYVSSFCKLMRINVFLFSQHGIRAIKELENTRVRVSPCGQFRQPIPRPCHNPVVLQSSRSLTEAKQSSKYLAAGNFYRQDVPVTSIPTEEHTNKSASFRSTFMVEASPENNFTRAHTPPISGPALNFTRRRVAAHVTLFLHTPPPIGASAANKPIHPLHAPRRRRKSPSFSLFLSGQCYCVLLSPESPLFFVFSGAPRHFQDLGSCFC